MIINISQGVAPFDPGVRKNIYNRLTAWHNGAVERCTVRRLFMGDIRIDSNANSIAEVNFGDDPLAG